MFSLRKIEFFADAQGGVMIKDDNGVRTYRQEERDLTDAMFGIIEADYPNAFKALTEIYAKSRANVGYFKYLLVHRFIRCNFSRLDRKLDIDEFGRFTFEDVECPLIGECKCWKVICNPQRDTKLTARQTDVMKLYCKRMTPEQIADELYISPETVATTKRNAFERVGVHSLSEFMTKFPEFLTE